MKTRIQKLIPVLIGIVFLTTFTTQCSLFEKDKEQPNPDYGIQVYPPNNETIWGYQIISVLYNFAYDIYISDIKIVIGGDFQSLISDDNPLRERLGKYDIEVNAEAISEPSIQILIEFVNNIVEPVILNYTINYMPVLQVTGEVDGYTLYLDAGETIDPEGKSLSFTWKSGDSTYSGPQIAVPVFQAIQNPVFISVTDGVTVITDLIQVDETTGDVTLVKDKLKCINLDIAKDGNPLLPGDPPLGPMIAEGTQLPVDANKKLTQRVMLGYNFEVRATLIPSTEDLDEGQDVAGTLEVNIDGNLETKNPEGLRRKEPNRSEFIPGKVKAPYPDKIPPPVQPVLVEDSYDHHPRNAYYYLNNATGVERKVSDSKQLGSFPTVSYIVWSDQPGLLMPKDYDLSKGTSYKAYFRSWLMPDLNLCQKYFTVEINIDSDGKVTKNSLTVLN